MDTDARLVERLTDLYPTRESVPTVARRAGIDPQEIPLAGSVEDQWAAVVQHARARHGIPALIQAVPEWSNDGELTALLAAAATPKPARRRTGKAGQMSPEVIGREEAEVLRDMAERLRQVELRAELTVQQLGYMTKSLDTLALAVSHRPNGLVPLWILTGLNTIVLVIIVSVIAELFRSIP